MKESTDELCRRGWATTTSGMTATSRSTELSTSFQIGNTVGISLFGLIFYRFLNNQSSSAAYLNAFKMILPYFTVMALAAFLIVFLLSQRRSTTVINRKNRFEAVERGLKEAEWEIRKNYSTLS